MEINGTEKPYLGSDIAIICEIQLTGDVEVETSVRWLKGKNNVTGIPNTITANLFWPPFAKRSEIPPSALISDKGRYACDVTIRAQGESSVSTESKTLSVIGNTAQNQFDCCNSTAPLSAYFPPCSSIHTGYEFPCIS